MQLEERELLKGKGRLLVLILSLVAVLALVGCGNNGTETKVSADEVVQNALGAQAEVSSCRMVVTIEGSAEGTMSGSALDATLSGSVDCMIDKANEKMKALVDADIAISGEQSYSGKAEADVYVVDNHTYMKASMLGMQQDWVKQAIPDDFWQSLASDNFQTTLLSSVDAELLKEDKVGGVNCYVLDITPNMAQLQQILQQMVSGESSDQIADTDIPDLQKLVKSLSIKVWIAKDTSFLTKAIVEVDLSITPDLFGETASGDSLEVEVNLTMTASDFNQSVSIQLPDEAKDAEEDGGFELPF